MTSWPAWIRWGLVLPLLTLNLFVIRQLLLPLAPFPGLFLTAALIAFLLDIPCRWLTGRGMRRWVAIVLVTLATIGALVFAALTLVPLLIEQLGQLINALPGLLLAAQEWVNRLQEWAAIRGLLRSLATSAVICFPVQAPWPVSSAKVCSAFSGPRSAPRSTR